MKRRSRLSRGSEATATCTVVKSPEPSAATVRSGLKGSGAGCAATNVASETSVKKRERGWGMGEKRGTVAMGSDSNSPSRWDERRTS